MDMRINRREALLGSLALASCAHGVSQEDLLIHGGPIYTGLAHAPRVEAVRVRDGRFVAVGSVEQVRSGGTVREINLRGAAAFPGFTDAHVHLTGVGMAAMVLDLVGVESIAALQQRLARYAREHPQGAIYGRGWIETHWPDRRFPNRADLDAVVSDRPVYLERIDGHAAVVNSAGLSLGGIDANTRDPAGGSIERDAAGAATGILIDNATMIVQSRLPAPTPAMVRQALALGARIYAERGWAGVHNMSTSLGEARMLEELARAGELPLHADIYLTPNDSAELLRRGPYGHGNVRVRGVKFYMDGALGSRGAALLAPYSDAHSDGLLVTPPEQLRTMYAEARRRGVQVTTHAIGDRGNRLVLDAYQDVFGDNPSALRSARWRIEHAQVLSQEDLPRFAALGVIASMQPSHAISDLHFAPARLGDARLGGAYAWKALLDSGAVVCGGSDAPVERGDPLVEFYAASYRHDLSGFAGPNWHLEEAVSRQQALSLFTSAAAYAAFSEDERGAIDIGKRADLSAFSVDLMTCAPSDIPRARAVLTVSDGRVTHERL